VTLGDWKKVDRYARIGIDADAGGQFAFWDGQFLMQRGIVQAWEGDAEGALASFTEGKARYTGIGGRSAMSTFEATLALHLARTGGRADAVARVEAARAELETYNERWNEPVVLIAEAVVAAAGGDQERATERLARAAEVATGQGAHTLAARARAVAADLGTRQSPGAPQEARSPGL
jgi:hypothetical protein